MVCWLLPWQQKFGIRPTFQVEVVTLLFRPNWAPSSFSCSVGPEEVTRSPLMGGRAGTLRPEQLQIRNSPPQFGYLPELLSLIIPGGGRAPGGPGAVATHVRHRTMILFTCRTCGANHAGRGRRFLISELWTRANRLTLNTRLA